jgi:hypothetical protein
MPTPSMLCNHLTTTTPMAQASRYQNRRRAVRLQAAAKGAAAGLLRWRRGAGAPLAGGAGCGGQAARPPARPGLCRTATPPYLKCSSVFSLAIHRTKLPTSKAKVYMAAGDLMVYC